MATKKFPPLLLITRKTMRKNPCLKPPGLQESSICKRKNRRINQSLGNFLVNFSMYEQNQDTLIPWNYKKEERRFLPALFKIIFYSSLGFLQM